MFRHLLSLTAAALLAGCSEEAPKPKAAKAAALQAGEYEVTTRVESIRSADNSTPATRSKAGDPAKVARTCVPADGGIDPAIFIEAGESCSAMDNYMRGGRMSLQYKCRRGSQQLTQMVDGDFTADSFDGKIQTATYFTGSGDYELVRTVTGKRVGDCPAANQEG